MKWPKQKISAFCQTGSGGTPSRRNADYYGGSISWVKSGELKNDVIIKTEEYITEKGLKESSAKLIPRNSILIAMYGATVGKTAILGVDAATNQAVCNIQPNPEIAHYRFVKHYLDHSINDLLQKRVGGAQPNVSQQIIKNIDIPLPPISEQQKIVEILDQADRLRKLRTYADKKAERILPSIFIKMFGDPSTNPMGWETSTMAEIIKETRNGLYKPAKFYGSGIGILKMFNIKNGELDLSRRDLISVEENEYQAYGLFPGDILINRVNTPALVGKCAVITEEAGKAVFESKNIRIRVNNKTTPEYISHYLNTTFGQRSLKVGIKHAIGMATINNTDLKNTIVLLPPLKVQKKWTKIVCEFQKNKKGLSTSYMKLEKLFKNLLHRAFTGDLTVSWRQAHMKKLLQEMEIQARALAK